MQLIHKFSVEPKAEEQWIELPVGAQILSAIEQNGEIKIYALCDKAKVESGATSKRLIYVVGTGWDFNDSNLNIKKFIGTVKVDWLVFHVLEVG